MKVPFLTTLAGEDKETFFRTSKQKRCRGHLGDSFRKHNLIAKGEWAGKVKGRMRELLDSANSGKSKVR